MMTQRPTVGLALGGGLARGIAHIGVLKELNREGIPVDYIAGTSMGSVIAALYASGLKLTMIEQLARRIKRRTWVDPTIPKMGLIAGDRLEELMSVLTGRRAFADMNIPLAVTVVEIVKGELVIIREGSVARAVRASCAIPGIFSPVESGEQVFVDGGVLGLVPIDAVKKMGANIVVAVDVTASVEEYPLENIFDVLSRTIEIMSREITNYQINSADIVIRPDMKGISPSHFDAAEDAVKKGEDAMKLEMLRLKSLINKGRELI